MIQYTINAGEIPKDHWINNPNIGGGRIIGEVCHFVDLCRYLVGSKIASVVANSINSNSQRYLNNDNVSINIAFENGSLSNIIYTSMGAKNYPKEHIKIFTNGSVGEIKNFVKAEIYTGSGRVRKSKLTQDKGFLDEYKYLSNVISGGVKHDYLTFEEMYEVTKATYDALNQL